MARAPGRRRLEQRLQLFLQGGDTAGQLSAIVARLVVIPGNEETRSDGKPGLAELFLLPPALGVGGEVPSEMGPTQLAPLRFQVVMGLPAVAGGDTREAITEQRSGLPLMAVGGDAKDGRAAGERTPEGALLTPGAPAGLIDIDRRGGPSATKELLIGRIKGVGCMLQDGIHRARGHAGTEQVASELHRVAAGDAVAHRQRGDGCLKTGTEGAPGDIPGQSGPDQAATLRAAHMVEAMLGHKDGDR